MTFVCNLFYLFYLAIYEYRQELERAENNVEMEVSLFDRSGF